MYYNEHVIAQTKPHWVTYLFSYFWFLLAVVLFVNSLVPEKYFNLVFVVSVIPFLHKYISNRFKTYMVTNQRVIYKEGILNRNEFVLPSININNVRLDANFIQRIMGTGSLTISTGNDSCLILTNIKNPKMFGAAISKMSNDSYSKMAI